MYLQLSHTFLMTVSPTSVGAERVFSGAGLLCTNIHARLSNTTLHRLFFKIIMLPLHFDIFFLVLLLPMMIDTKFFPK